MNDLDLGNFYTYLPGGSRRQFLRSQPELLLPHVDPICGLIDDYLSENGFNISELSSLVGEYERLRLSSRSSNNDIRSKKIHLDSLVLPAYYFVRNNSAYSEDLLKQ